MGVRTRPNKDKKKFKQKKFNRLEGKIRENEFNTFDDKDNRSASPHSMSVSRANIKGRSSTNGRNKINGKAEYSPDKNNFIPRVQDVNIESFDYLQPK